MNDETTTVLLMECFNTVEADAVKSLLGQHGIEVVVVAPSSYMPHLQAIMAPRVMVFESDLERARAILGATPMTGTTGEGYEGGVCAVHEQPAVAICSRCGSFLCASCGSLGDPPVCESCMQQEALPERNRTPARAQLYLLITFIIVGVLLALILNVGHAR